MANPGFPWYDIVEGNELEQGDIITNCPSFTPVGKIVPNSKVAVNWQQRDLIVLSQSCDLVKDRKRLSDVLTAPVWKTSELRGHLATPKGLEDARRGNLPSVHLLAQMEFDFIDPGVRVVDFRGVITIPIEFLLEQIEMGTKRVRLLPPYREHLSQAFARFVMRVGLPVDIPPFK